MAGILILMDSMMLRRLRFGILDSESQSTADVVQMLGKQERSWQHVLVKCQTWDSLCFLLHQDAPLNFEATSPLLHALLRHWLGAKIRIPTQMEFLSNFQIQIDAFQDYWVGSSDELSTAKCKSEAQGRVRQAHVCLWTRAFSQCQPFLNEGAFVGMAICTYHGVLKNNVMSVKKPLSQLCKNSAGSPSILFRSPSPPWLVERLGKLHPKCVASCDKGCFGSTKQLVKHLRKSHTFEVSHTHFFLQVVASVCWCRLVAKEDTNSYSIYILHHSTILYLVGGWATPLKNMSSSIGMIRNSQYFWENKKLQPNHQPDTFWFDCGDRILLIHPGPGCPKRLPEWSVALQASLERTPWCWCLHWSMALLQLSDMMYTWKAAGTDLHTEFNVNYPVQCP